MAVSQELVQQEVQLQVPLHPEAKGIFKLTGAWLPGECPQLEVRILSSQEAMLPAPFGCSKLPGQSSALSLHYHGMAGVQLPLLMFR